MCVLKTWADVFVVWNQLLRVEHQTPCRRRMRVRAVCRRQVVCFCVRLCRRSSSSLLVVCSSSLWGWMHGACLWQPNIRGLVRSATNSALRAEGGFLLSPFDLWYRHSQRAFLYTQDSFWCRLSRTLPCYPKRSMFVMCFIVVLVHRSECPANLLNAMECTFELM